MTDRVTVTLEGSELVALLPDGCTVAHADAVRLAELLLAEGVSADQVQMSDWREGERSPLNGQKVALLARMRKGYTYSITRRPDALGGGWRLRLLEDGEEVGGGVFPVDDSDPQQGVDWWNQLPALDQSPHVDYLARLIDGESCRRDERGIARRVAAARFPVLKTLEQFDWSWPTSVNQLQIRHLFRLAFLEPKGNVEYGLWRLSNKFSCQVCNGI